MRQKIPITVAHGAGIDSEIMDASLHIIQEAVAALEVETIEIGEKVYLRGNIAGIDPSSWESLRRTKIFYKAPIATPQGGGWPGGMSETFVIDSFRCCYQPVESAAAKTVSHAQIAAIYQKIFAAGYDIVKTETLRTFDGQQGFTLAQGQ